MKRRFWLLASIMAAVVAAGAGPSDVSMTVVDAARNGDRETLRALLTAGADVNDATGDGMSALHWAAIRGDVETTTMLLYAGANVSATTRLLAYTPLLLAAENGRAAVVDLLLDAGGNPNVASATGTSALMFAAASGNVDAVRSLLDRGADVDATESTRGYTPLMFAAASGRQDVIAFLTEHGANVSRTSLVVDAPTLNKELDEAFRARIDQLLKDREAAAGDVGRSEAPAEKKNEDKRNFFAKLFGWIVPGGGDAKEEPKRRERESFGARVGVQGGMTALLLAARQGEDACVDTLLESGADVNQVAEGSLTSPLLIAIMNGRFDLAMDLLEQGADPNLASEPAGVTPLYAAINLQWAPHSMYPQPTAQKQQQTTHLELMKALLVAGADPNPRLKKKVWFMHYNFDTSGLDETGATPFWRAAYGSDVAAMELLRSFGADPFLRTQAVEGRRLRGDDADEDQSGLPPVPEGGPAMTALHAAAGAGFGAGFAANDHHNHPAGFMPAVKYLVEECGLDVNARDQDGATALHNAASRGDVEMIQYLVEKGADVTFLTRRGQSTADMANGPVQRIQPFPEARDLLVSLGAVNHNKCVSC